MPFSFPQLKYREYDYKIPPNGDAINSGEGRGINHMDENEVEFEAECPKSNMDRTIDLHYELHEYFSTQVLT